MTGVRWPWAPLEEAIGGGTWSTMAARLGAHQRQISRWKADGLSDVHADRCAIAIGLHPVLIWPDWDEVELDDVA